MKLMQHHIILNWTGRITGILVTAFFAAFFVGEGIPDILNGKGDELLQFLPFTALSAGGFILAWFKPLWGGWLMALIYGIPSLLVGLCFIASANKELI
jgi:uncharacterized membrane protein HdeD (DUF308 family)